MITIDYKDRRPIYEQIIANIENLVERNLLEPNEQLPTVRQLAMELSINPNTIQRAYTELERAGVIYSTRGKGNFIADNSEQLRQEKTLAIFEQMTALGMRAIELGADEARMNSWFSSLTQATKGRGKND